MLYGVGQGGAPEHQAFVTGISSSDEGVGWYSTRGNSTVAFVRVSGGNAISFRAAEEGIGNGQGTVAVAINGPGTITGEYVDSSGVSHGFFRSLDSTFTGFDAPDAGNTLYQAILPSAVNGDGAIAGSFTDSANLNRAYVRDPGWIVYGLDPPYCTSKPIRFTSSIRSSRKGKLVQSNSENCFRTED